MKGRAWLLLASLAFTPTSLTTKVTRQLADDNQTLATETQDSCGAAKIKLDAYTRKDKYLIGVHDSSGGDGTMHEYSLIFEEYLTATAGQKFDPPITFEMVPLVFEEMFAAAENKELDFMFSNPGIYACVGTQLGATALTTVVHRVTTRGQTADLDVYGGVIAVRHDRDDIKSLKDLEGKIIAASEIVDLMGGQMQIYEMVLAGMSYVNDPIQFIFTGNQEDIVLGLISGRFDVGFVRTGQIESTKDENGNFVDPDLFKILEPQIYILEDGALFPFLHSTEVFPEWPVAALPGVPSDIQVAVQDALINFGAFVEVGETIETACSSSQAEAWCDFTDVQDVFPDLPCTATNDLIKMSTEAHTRSNIAGFRTALSYFKVRTMLQAAGFLIQNAKDEWFCTRPSSLFEGVTCPEGFFKRREDEFDNGCSHIGLPCDDSESFTCFCRPCVRAYEVDVYYLEEGENDPHLNESYDDEYPGCDKMEICAKIQQGQSVKLRIFDNMMRNDTKITVEVHAGDKDKKIQPERIPGTSAYEFVVTDREVQVQVIEILVDGKPIATSPIRVVVEDFDCEAANPGENLVPNNMGECVCAGNTYQLGNKCLETHWFFIIIFSIVAVAVGIAISFYLGYKKQQNDSIWHVQPDELYFNEPPEIIGQGAFGVVILGQYRGTKVAVKRVLPPVVRGVGSKGSLKSSEDAFRSGSAEIHDVKATSKKEGTVPRRGSAGKSVRISTENAVDLESGDSISKIGGTKAGGSVSGSNKDWEQLLNLRHSDNDILRVLESATGSSHGSDTVLGSVSKNHVVLRYVPLWMRWDEHSVRIREFQTEMRMISRLRHPCITTVMGAVFSNRVDPMLVLEFMEYGSLYDLIRNETMTPNGEIILQIVRDIVQGIQFLHASKPPILHGDLKAKNILVDSRFRAKVADFGFSHMKTAKVNNIIRGTPYYMAPEYVRRRSEYTTQCDIYSLAMIIYEIYARKGPFEGEDPRKILPKICHPRHNKRPPIPEACPPKMLDLMKKCWSANAAFRPQAKDMDYLLVEMNSQDTEPLKTQEELARELVKRKPTSLFDVFPKKVAEALNAGKKVEAETHDMVSIFFSDIVGFTTISQTRDAMKVSNMLDRLYTVFDNLSRQHKVFKVETIGDAWMGVTNLDNDECESHARQIAEFALDAIRGASKIRIDEDDLSAGYVNIRVGLHSGPVVANVVGTLNPRYGLFGDTVNTASRMESNSLPGRIQCSSATADLLKQQAVDIRLELRGMVDIKGKGKMKTYWVGPENLAMLPPSSFLVHGMEPLSERDDEDNIDIQNDTSESEHVSELNDSFNGDDTALTDTRKSSKKVATQMVVSVCTTATDSMSSEGSHSGQTHPSSLKSHLGKHHEAVTISMDGSVQSVATEES